MNPGVYHNITFNPPRQQNHTWNRLFHSNQTNLKHFYSEIVKYFCTKILHYDQLYIILFFFLLELGDPVNRNFSRI